MAVASVIDAKPWVPITPRVTCGSLCRSPEHLRAVLEQLEVLTNPRYQPTPGATYCNVFVWDATRALACEIPHWTQRWEKAPDGSALVRAVELSANDIADWLAKHGSAHGWTKIGILEAEQRALAGFPTVAVWRSPDARRSGHVAVLMPGELGLLTIAQAGATNLFGAPLAKGFGDHQPVFWTHA